MSTTVQVLCHVPFDFPVVDATEDLFVPLTKKGIDLGKQHDPSSCAFSVDWRNCDGKILRLEVLKTTAYAIFFDRIVRYKLPARTAKAIKDFDIDKKLCIPGIYKFRAPTGTNRLGVKRSSGSHKGKESNEPRVITSWIRGKEPKVA